MKKITIVAITLITLAGCAEMTSVMEQVSTEMGSTTPSLTNDEVIRGLREALTVGTNNSSSLTSKLDGFYKNPEIFIPFPEEAIKVKNTVEDLGMKKQVDEFVMTLNRAAETATKEAAPIFVNAIKEMTIADGFAILRGNDNAATQYLKDKTSAQLKVKFNPVVKNAIQKVEVTKYWNPVINTYNKVPFVEPMNPNLEDYITTKAMDGLFLMIEKEEAKIRKDPLARVTDLLKKVFQ
ncbi:MAG: DUF4197 domain-containing protein [Flavobacteriales bacterium]|nr:DUF4197 domain-containing protein [Flavobacteriales bacterium]MCB9174380.1 DUF4197 domain-containing protein [Flavobacteriales bacterium]